MTESTLQTAGLPEIRLYGLHSTITSEQLIAFFSYGVLVQGAALFPSADGSQWARIWVKDEKEISICMERKAKLAENGITMIRASTAPGWMTPDSARKPILPLSAFTPTPIQPPFQGVKTSPPELSPSWPSHVRYRTVSSGGSSFGPITSPRLDHGGLGYRHVDPSGPSPRNLYIMGLPLDLTQIQFKALFTEFGMVEHSILLSQLDSMGRRRGFVLMSTHREAVLAMNSMNGKQIEGHGVDVSWALRQREAQQIGPGVSGMGNRVLHPPTSPVRRQSFNGYPVVVENLDPNYFPSTARIQDVFVVFGPIIKVAVLSGSPIKVVVHFEHEISATALINSSGHEIGGQPIHTYAYQPTISQFTIPPPAIPERRSPPVNTERKSFTFDPFRDSSPAPKFSLDSQLSAASNPFIPPASIQLPSSERTGSSGKLSELSGSTGNGNSHCASRTELKAFETWQ